MVHSETLKIVGSPSDVSCAHCGALAPQGVGRAEGQKWFCCAGCSTVFNIIQSCGLDQFYQIKRDGVCFSNTRPISENQTTKFENWNSPNRNIDLYIEGIHCSACLWLLEKLPHVIPQTVQQCHLSLGTSRLNIELTPDGKLSDAANWIQKLGYTPHLIESKNDLHEKIKDENQRRLIDLAIAGALSGNTMLMSIPIYAGAEQKWVQLFAWLSALLAAGSVFYAGRSLNQDVWRAFKSRTFTIQIPIVFSIWTAFFYSIYDLFHGFQKLYFDSLTMLIFLLLSSRYVLARLRQQGFGQGKMFTLFQEDTSIAIGSIQRLSPFTMIRFDGIVRSGDGFFDLSHLTGESYPVRLRSGDHVFAGSKLVQNAEILVEVKKIGGDTRMGKIFSVVENLKNKKSRSEARFDVWAKRLFMLVSLIAVGNAIHGVMAGNMHSVLHNTLAFLIVTCPCALGLAAPLAQSLLVKRALKSMLLIRDIDAIENVLEIDTVVFDKTGTLTEGQLSVVDFPVPEQFHPILMNMAKSTEHPVAKAIAGHLAMADWTRQMNSENLFLPEVSETVGQGVHAKDICGIRYFLGERPGVIGGSRKCVFFEVIWPQKTFSYQIELRDKMRADVVSTLKKIEKSILKRHKKATFELLSGDSVSAVAAAACGIREMDGSIKFDLAVGRCSPEFKAERVQQLIHEGKKVLFVGDGINDANAMALSLVSLAMAGGLQDLKYQSSAVALVSSLGPVSELFVSAELLRKVHKLNFFYSTFYNAVSGSLALAGLMTPLIAAFVMPIAATTVFLASKGIMGSYKSEAL